MSFSDRFLSEEDLVWFTGLEKPTAQSRWLSRQGITHFVNVQNKVRVTWQAVNNPRTAQAAPDFSNVA